MLSSNDHVFLEIKVPKFQIHDWDEALAAFIATHQQIIAILQTKDDTFLSEPVDYRQYNFRYLLNGLIQHTIYHLGQIVYLKKLLAR